VAATLLLRADAGTRTGTGHVMRSLALADVWRAAGRRTIFVSHCPTKKLRDWIRSSGAELVSLQRPHPDPEDLQTTLALLSKARSDDADAGPPWVALDGYHFDETYQRAICEAGGRLLVIDDLACLNRFHAHVILNQNAQAEQLDYPCDPATLLLLGSRYVLLRPEFRRWRDLRREPPQVARKVLVTAGGSDPDNVTRTLIAALKRLDVPEYDAKVVVGAANPHFAAMKGGAETSGARFHRARHVGNVPHNEDATVVDSPPETPIARNVQILSSVPDMAELMAWADVALSAAGITCWEMAWMQLPAVLVVLADNQMPIARHVAEAGAAINLGRAEKLNAEQIAEVLSALCHDRERRARQSRAGRRLIDGRGTERVVALMDSLDHPVPAERMRLRPAVAADVRPIWRLANDPTVRGHSFSPEPIPLDEHEAWFRQKLADPAARIWVLEYQGLIVAVIRYDRTDVGAAEISFHVAPAFRRRGLGMWLLNETRRPAGDELGVGRVRAVVREENVASIRTFHKAGFTRADSRMVRGRPCHIFERTTR